MNVRLLAQISGTRNGADWPIPGSVVDLPDGEASDLIASGQAVDAADPVPADSALLRLDRSINPPTVIEAVTTATPAHPVEPLVPVAVVQPPAVIDGDATDEAAGFLVDNTTPKGKIRASAAAASVGDAEQGPEGAAVTADPDAPVVPEDARVEVPIPVPGETPVAKPRSKS